MVLLISKGEAMAVVGAQFISHSGCHTQMKKLREE
jgi:hypothetical protein